MSEPIKEDPGDPQAGWPARFSNETMGWSGLLFAAVLAATAAGFREVFDSAGLFDRADAPRQVAAYVLYVVGLLCMLGGVWFALLEARTPPAQPRALRAERFPTDPATLAGSLRGHKVSVVLLSMGFVLLTAAAAGSGLVQLHVGGQDQPVSTTTTTR